MAELWNYVDADPSTTSAVDTAAQYGTADLWAYDDNHHGFVDIHSGSPEWAGMSTRVRSIMTAADTNHSLRVSACELAEYKIVRPDADEFRRRPV